MTDDRWPIFEGEGAGFTLRYPPAWRPIEKARGTTLVLLGPISDSDFRPSLAIASESIGDADLDQVVRDTVSEMDRYFTDYESHGIEPHEVSSHEGRFVKGTYRHGRVTVAMDQWIVQTPGRLWSFTASYDKDLAGDFPLEAAEIMKTVSLTP